MQPYEAPAIVIIGSVKGSTLQVDSGSLVK